MSEVDETRISDEWTRFGVLVIVLIVVVLVVALSRPLIFGVIVPAVLGDGLDISTRPIEPARPDAGEAAGEEPSEPLSAPSGSEEEVVTPPEAGVEEAVETGTQGAEPLPTLVTATTHVVKSGETLTVISNQYNVPVESIVNANNLASADRIKVGDQLTIPQK
jgi:hypothetical protein